MTGVTRFTAAAVLACATLAAVEVARLLGGPLPREVELVMAAVAGVLAAAVALRHLASIRRGPVIVAFRRREGVLCDVAEAAAIRAAAQLRGTMGGAGHVQPWRLAFSAAAWAAAAAQAAVLVSPGRGPGAFLPLVALVLAGGLATLFPARPFYYREVAGGCVLAHPSDACMRLLDAAGIGPAFNRLDPTAADPRTVEWVSSPSAPEETGGNPPADELRPDA